jgi:hypothetical protein
MLPDRICLYGTEHFTDFDAVEQEADRRIRLTGDDVYGVIAKSAALNEEDKDMDDYAKLWELADASNGVVYSKTVPDPYRIFNTGKNKHAYYDALNQHIVLAGAVVPRGPKAVP